MPAALPPDWLHHLGQEFEKPYMKTLKSFLLEEKQQGFTIYPKSGDIFNAFNHTPFEKVKVVILGQDPYHGAGQAHGLSFSVQKGMVVPPSLKNMYKELANEFPDFKIPSHGNLTSWADQGVLLLNATLTVRAQEAGSHQKKGWEIFTDRVISALSEQRSGLIFLLWGRYAQQKESLIDQQKHHILKAAHPSPFSAYNGFFGSGHFAKANELLVKEGLKPINWQLED
ncbi:uracil-DNA glycosylase [Pedobacter insulae]|uniref:Uracil-DNA glycosylase n=1 Tax=Pedobacter insulae TaxID=414048 RepID=A0A1I2UJN5_9SPHI|nr:uracil-DNA glycosylase [Pedobacter insulae]SFG77345.1 Uracil-DNA glycosylase [Pedobacter insulae]